MTNLVPGFVWHPIDVSGRAKRAKGRGLAAHVAVSESTNLVPSGTPATRSADWHFYLPKSGPGIQYIDLDYQCWATAAGNGTLPAFESQGGVTSPQTEPWTDNQLNLAAQILAHLHRTEGTPLQVMPNSLPSSKGIAPHRWGIDPWRVPGGEVWSSSRGKVCPGDAKVAQLPLIVLRAAQIVTPQEDDMTPDQATTLANMAWQVGQMKPSLDEVHGMLKGADPNHDNVWLLWAALYGQNPPGNGNEIIKALGKAPAPVIDEAKLAAALLADPAGVDRLGAAIAAHLKLTSS